MSNVLTVKHLSKSYNSLSGEVLAVNDVSFSVKEGEMLAIIGTSGCGKSTILNVIAGLDKDYSGKILFKEKTKVSYMLQDDTLFPWLTVMENASLGLKVQNKLTLDNIKYVKYLLKKYGLGDFIDKKVSSLSGGMRQRVLRIRYTHK